MAEPSKELLDPIPKPSILETILVSRGSQEQQELKRKERFLTNPLHKSQVLGKVKNFLGEIAKANEELQLDAQNKPREDVDIEVLTGNEKEYIEMDLLLGIADLHSDKAVEAAEATMSCFPPSVRSFACSSSDSDDDTDESDEDGGGDSDASPRDSSKDSDPSKNGSGKEKKPNKRPKIVVLN